MAYEVNMMDAIMHKLYSDMQKFYYTKDVVGFAVSVTMGFATRDVIMSIVHDIIIPCLKHLAKVLYIRSIYDAFLTAAKRQDMLATVNALSKVCYSIFIWLILLVFSFLLLEYLVGKTILGFRSAPHNQQEIQEFNLAKAEAKTDVIPDDDDYDKTRYILL